MVALENLHCLLARQVRGRPGKKLFDLLEGHVTFHEKGRPDQAEKENRD
jgi:hypothetical protein